MWAKHCRGCNCNRSNSDFLPDQRSQDKLLSYCKKCLHEAKTARSTGKFLLCVITSSWCKRTWRALLLSSYVANNAQESAAFKPLSCHSSQRACCLAGVAVGPTLASLLQGAEAPALSHMTQQQQAWIKLLTPHLIQAVLGLAFLLQIQIR